MFLAAYVLTYAASRPIRVLAIGNSFSEDAVEQNLYELAAAQGDSLVIGNAYIGGCSINRHLDMVASGKAAYRYRKIVGGVKTTRPNVSLDEIIRDDQWNLITLQQASHDSGLPDTYARLGELKQHVLDVAVNKDVQIAFHMTWAYAQNSTHQGFRHYDNDQQKMYDMICSAVRQAIHATGIEYVIPSGIAIQNARHMMGDVLCRDGYHLQLTYGRYTAACVWCEFITGKSVVGNPYIPEGMSRDVARMCQKAAHKAIKQSRKTFQIKNKWK